MDTNSTKHIIGKNIRELRQQRNMTLEEVGKFLNVGRSNVSKYERGEIAVPYDKILALSTLFQVSPAHLMGWNILPGGSQKIEGVVDLSDRPYITLREASLLAEFEQLNEENKDKLLYFIDTLVELQKLEASLKAKQEALEWYEAHKQDLKNKPLKNDEK